MIDTHCHLDQLRDPESALDRAAARGITGVVAVAENWASSRTLLAWPRHATVEIFPCAGVHPGRVPQEDLDGFIGWLNDNVHRCTAVGEIGLDFWYKWVRKDEGERNRQREALRRQCAVAARSGKAVVIHSRGAWAQALDILRQEGIEKAVFHWYSGPLDVLDQILAAGYFVSCTPALALSEPARAAMTRAPLERILVETDAPVSYRLSLQSEERFTAEPADVRRTVAALAVLKGVPEEQVADITTANARTLFGRCGGKQTKENPI